MLTPTAAKAWTHGSSELTYADDLYGDYEPDADDDGDDRNDEYKDDLAMGYINPDGSQREPDYPEDGGYDPWDYRPSLRRRIRWRISEWRRRLVFWHRNHGYSDEPSF
jgi:hypothetical protein